MDQPLQWSEAFAIGHPQLDADHRALVDAISAICGACAQECEPQHLRAMLNDLEKVTKEHFQHEDAVLREIISRAAKSPSPAQAISKVVLKKHIDEHARTFSELQFIAGAATLTSLSARQSLCEKLKIWLIDHAVKGDAHLKSVFQAM